MLSVLLTILKVLGIVILAILGLIIFLLLVVLLVPFRYKIYAKKDEAIYANVSVTWLLHFVSVIVEYKDGINIAAKLLGIKVFPPKPKKPKKSKKEKPVNDDAIEVTQENPKAEPQKQVPEMPEPDIPNEVVKQEPEPEESSNNEKTGEDSESKPKKSIKEKINEIVEKVQNTIEGIKKFVRDLITNTQEKVQFIIEMINDESNKKALACVWKNIKSLIKHILPTKHKIKVYYGSEDPAQLGQIIGYVAMAKAATNINLDFTPDFTKNVVEGEILLKGRLRLFFVVCLAIKIYKDKDVRKFLKNFTK